MLLPISIVSRLPRLARSMSACLLGRQAVVTTVAVLACLLGAAAQGQVLVYETLQIGRAHV